jgi:hypothetical protein
VNKDPLSGARGNIREGWTELLGFPRWKEETIALSPAAGAITDKGSDPIRTLNCSGYDEQGLPEEMVERKDRDQLTWREKNIR